MHTGQPRAYSSSEVVRRWRHRSLLTTLATGALLFGVLGASLFPPRTPELVRPLPVSKDPLLGAGQEAVDCYVDVLGHPGLATAGELGAWLRSVVVGVGQHKVRIVHPVRATLYASHAQGSFMLTFEYDGTEQTDAGSPPRAAYLPFLGVAKALCLDAQPQFVFQTGLLLAITAGQPANNEPATEGF